MGQHSDVVAPLGARVSPGTVIAFTITVVILAIWAIVSVVRVRRAPAPPTAVGRTARVALIVMIPAALVMIGVMLVIAIAILE